MRRRRESKPRAEGCVIKGKYTLIYFCSGRQSDFILRPACMALSSVKIAEGLSVRWSGQLYGGYHHRSGLESGGGSAPPLPRAAIT